MASTSPHVRLPLATFRFWKQYFRFETEGFDVLATTEPSLIVGYHGGPWTFDLWMLAARMYDELGYFPRASWHRIWWQFPALGEVVTELGGLPGPPTDADVIKTKSRGEHLVMAPGGTREALRPFWRNHRVDFGRRRGYLRLAHAHDLPIIPVVASGLDETFLGLNDGHALSRLLGREAPAWLALGLGGIWPCALPFPVKIRQRIGSPIRLGSLPYSVTDGDESVEKVNAHVTMTLQSMLDELRRAHSRRLPTVQ
jgi:1-acyl-sn-glycerol-3-phosphate acyltransferase